MLGMNVGDRRVLPAVPGVLGVPAAPQRQATREEAEQDIRNLITRVQMQNKIFGAIAIYR